MHKLRGAAAAIKRDLFPFKRPPRHDSFMRWLGGRPTVQSLPSGKEGRQLIVNVSAEELSTPISVLIESQAGPLMFVKLRQ